MGLAAAVFGAFGGMLIGWSLQAPVTGFIAWVLIILLRPFKVGDRILLPSYSLVGDVVKVGPLYTVLNQIGGTVGSEEPVNRAILIPNTMLFGNLVINYTPRLEKEEIKEEHPIEHAPAYILDEIVWSIPIGSNLDEAERVLLNAAREVTAEIIKETGQEPYVRGEPYQNGITLRLRYMTLATDRPRISYEISRRIYKEFLQPYRVGDRISVPSWGIVGDVVKVGPLYTVLNQVGGTVGSEEPVNRLVHLPNHVLWSLWHINYTPQVEEAVLPVSTQPFYTLDEVVWRITFDSDWKVAEEILLNAAREVTAEIIKETGQEPYVRSDVYDYGVYMRLRYTTRATERPRISHEINKRIFKAFSENEKVDFAIPYIYSFKKGREWAPPSTKDHFETSVGLKGGMVEENPLTRTCPHCQAKNLFNAGYCSKCGKGL